MKINRYRWTPQGMVYDPAGEWMDVAVHEAVVASHEAEQSRLVSTNAERCKSLEDRLAQVPTTTTKEV